STASGLAAADAELFRDRPFLVVPTARSDDRAMAVAGDIARAAGGRVAVLSASVHDAAMGRLSALPLAVAAATTHVAAEGDLAPAGPGFRDTTRLAATPVDLAVELLLGNADAAAAEITKVVRELDRVAAATVRTRSLSCFRVCPMPVSSVGSDAWVAMAARVGKTSEQSRTFARTPCSSPIRRTQTAPEPCETLQPIAATSSKNRASPWAPSRRRASTFAIVTFPPRTAPAAAGYVAAVTSPGIRRSRGRILPSRATMTPPSRPTEAPRPRRVASVRSTNGSDTSAPVMRTR